MLSCVMSFRSTAKEDLIMSLSLLKTVLVNNENQSPIKVKIVHEFMAHNLI